MFQARARSPCLKCASIIIIAISQRLSRLEEQEHCECENCSSFFVSLCACLACDRLQEYQRLIGRIHARLPILRGTGLSRSVTLPVSGHELVSRSQVTWHFGLIDVFVLYNIWMIWSSAVSSSLYPALRQYKRSGDSTSRTE